MKIERNDSCLCGSGKKYKKCCKDNIRPPRGTLTKAYEYGPNDPFCARIMFQILKIRNQIYSEKQKIDEFDKIYDSVFQNLLEAKIVKERCINLINSHLEESNDGKTVVLDNDLIRVNKSIDEDLNIWFKDFFVRGNMAFSGLIYLIGYLGYNISFFFADDKKFLKRKQKFLNENPDIRFKEFVNLIEKDRPGWLTGFNKLRNAIEHEGFKLPKMQYFINNGKVKPIFPVVNSMRIEKLLNTLWENLFMFSEEMLVFFMSQKLPENLMIVRVPENLIDPQLPIKYKVIPKNLPPGMHIDITHFEMN